jgi:hypothetical protein
MSGRGTDRKFLLISAIGGIIIGPTYGDLMGG